MKQLLIIAFLSIVSFFSCKNQKSANNNASEQSALASSKPEKVSKIENTNVSIENDNENDNSLSDSKKLVSIIKTKKFLIRIDQLKNDKYRYTSWSSSSSMSKKPDLILNNGVFVREGTGGNHRYEFTNKNYTYIIDMNVLAEDGTPDAFLRVLKNGKQILKQDGTVVDNKNSK